MRRMLFAFVLTATCMAASSALAQGPSNRLNGKTDPTPHSSVDMKNVQATPEMWFYEQQMKRYNDPKEMVRQNAAMAAAQRKQRLAALKWYGYSNSRPTVNPTPFGASYAPTWNNATIRPWSWAATTKQIYTIQRTER